MRAKNNQQLHEAFAECKRIALGHYENFPVGSMLIPRSIRPHFYALYAFMRTTDDFADLSHRPYKERLALLAQWREHLEETYKTQKQPSHPIFIALKVTVEKYQLKKELFTRLLDAFSFDATGDVTFETFNDLHWYTERSAEPVGTLVLALFGYHDEKRIEQSNAICTALQLINFLQDAEDDLVHGRNYFPREDYALLGLDRLGAQNSNEVLTELVRIQLARIRALLSAGAPLSEGVTGRLRYELRAVLWGAKRMIEKLEKLGSKIFTERPKLSKLEHLSILGISILDKPRNF